MNESIHGFCQIMHIFVTQKFDMFRKRNDGTFHHSARTLIFKINLSPVVNLQKQQLYERTVPLPTRREDRLRITSTLLGGTHRCVPYGIIVFSFTFSTFNLIYVQREAFLNFEFCILNFAFSYIFLR